VAVGEPELAADAVKVCCDKMCVAKKAQGENAKLRLEQEYFCYCVAAQNALQ